MSDFTKILFIDDENDAVVGLQFFLGEAYKINHVRDMKRALPLLEKETYDLILLDLDLEKTRDYKEGLQNITIIKERFVELPLVIISQTRSQDIAVEAMDRGANYFFWKSDFNGKKWQRKIDELTSQKYLRIALEKLEKEQLILKRRLRAEKEAQYPFIGKSPQIVEIKKTLKFLAEKKPNLTVLLTGETGVGKEVAAHYFYAHSIRNQHEFVPVNLSSIQKDLFESTLFGHRKGSFTGADQDRIGYCKQADKGVLFLDEIGELDLDSQVKILRFLQDKKIRIVGETEVIQLDVQIVAATNKKLVEAVENKEFRSDLFQRLNTYPIHIPPLRERKEDIMMIVAHYLKVPQKLVEKQFFTPKAKQLFLEYPWLGNVRELVNAVKYMEIQQEVKGKEQFDEACLPQYVLDNKSFKIDYNKSRKGLSHDENMALKELERIEAALSKKSKKREAAELLGINTDGLRYKVKGLKDKYPYLVQRFGNIKKAYKIN